MPDVRSDAMVRPDAGRPTPAPTDLQRRIAEALNEATARRQDVRGGSPEDIPEVTREITMLRGALVGVHQRIGELAGDLLPVLDPEIVNRHVVEGGGGPSNLDEHGPAVVTEVGREVREIANTVSEIEATLAFLRHAVRL